MRSSGEVFGLVAMRDPQRRVPPGTLWAPACNLVTPVFRQAPRAAHGIAALGTVAYRYISRHWSGDCHGGRRTQAQDLSSRAALNQSGYFLRQLWMESAEDRGDRLKSRTSRNRRSLPVLGVKG